MAWFDGVIGSNICMKIKAGFYHFLKDLLSFFPEGAQANFFGDPAFHSEFVYFSPLADHFVVVCFEHDEIGLGEAFGDGVVVVIAVLSCRFFLEKMVEGVHAYFAGLSAPALPFFVELCPLFFGGFASVDGKVAYDFVSLLDGFEAALEALPLDPCANPLVCIAFQLDDFFFVHLGCASASLADI
jgi:hypothetical protein